MANTNRYPGLARGPIDHNASSVINSISNDAIVMGSPVSLITPIESAELLPRVGEIAGAGQSLIYGIAVGGDADGVYGDGAGTSPLSFATEGAGQGVVVVTQGRCPARVSGSGGAVIIGDKLSQSATAGALQKAAATHTVIAIALNDVDALDLDIIAVDVQREGDVET